MANTSSRTLRLLSLLQNHRYWSGPELAERLEVSMRTVRRDVDRLRELGYPVEAHRGVDGGYQLAAGAALPPLVVDDEEAVALAVGLRLAAQGAFRSDGGAQATIAEASARALAKVTQVMPSRLRRQVEAVATMTESATWESATARAASAIDPEVLTGAALACRDAERIRFGYVAASGEQSARHVEPHRLVALDRRWYLVGYDLDRQDWRSFRLDRMTVPPGKAVPAGKAASAGKAAPAGKQAAIQPTGARFRPRQIPGGDAAAFVRAGASARPAGQEVIAIVEAPAAAVRERIGSWSSNAEMGPSRCRVTMTPPENSDWAIIALGVAGADFQVISPPELADRVRDWGARFTRAAGPG